MKRALFDVKRALSNTERALRAHEYLVQPIAFGVSFIVFSNLKRIGLLSRGGGLGSRPKKMYGERLGDGVEYHLMSPTPRREVPFTTGRRAHEIS